MMPTAAITAFIPVTSRNQTKSDRFGDKLPAGNGRTTVFLWRAHTLKQGFALVKVRSAISVVGMTENDASKLNV
ncbi:hypothetical protein D9M70_618980 [compost metagenome]